MNIFTTVNKRIVWFTLASNFFIIIAAGHGIGFLGLLEIIDFPYVTKGFTLTLQASDDSLPHAACLFSAIGSLLLLTSLIIPTGLARLIIRPLALIFAWIGLFYLLYSVGNGTGQNVAIVTAIPFILLSLLLLIQSIAGIIKLTRYNPPYT